MDEMMAKNKNGIRDQYDQMLMHKDCIEESEHRDDQLLAQKK